MLSFLLLFPLAALLFYLALIFTSTGFVLLGAAVILLGMISFALLLVMKGKVVATLSIPVRMAQPGKGFGVRVRINNGSLLPIGKLRVFLKYDESHEPFGERTTLTYRELPKGESIMTQELSIGLPGYYEFAMEKIRLYDLFGIFFWDLKSKEIAHVTVFPNVREVPVRIGEAVRNFYGEAVSYDEFRPGNDPGEIFDVREFRDGDKLQRVHWSLSARMEDILVKEYSQPKSPAVILIMPEGPMGENGSLEFMASLSFTLLDMKCDHYLVWFSRSRSDIVRIRVNDEESFYFAEIVFLQDSVRGSEGDRLERYREKYRGEPFLHSIFADEAGNLRVDGGEPLKIRELREELFLR